MTDTGGKSSLGIVEVIVTAGPNLRAPVFNQDLYEILVQEGSPKQSLVHTFQVNTESILSIQAIGLSLKKKKHFICLCQLGEGSRK